MRKQLTLLLMTGWLLFMTACPSPHAGDPPAGELPAVDLTVRVTGFAVELSWVNPAGAAGFDVYRQEGEGAFVLAAGAADNRNNYTDTACAYNTPLVYYLVLRLDTGAAVTSRMSDRVQVNFTPPAVTGLTASRLLYSDHIHITWEAAAGAEKYLLYRYTAKTAEPEIFFECTTNVFDDYADGTDGAVGNRLYYYRAACGMRKAVSALNANFIEGIYSAHVDDFEPNQDKLHAAETGSQYGTGLLYSFNRGAAQDVDWYKYTGTGSSALLEITVILPDGSPLAGKIILEIDGVVDPTLLDEQENTLYYSKGEAPLYFRISFQYAELDDCIAEYQVKVEVR